MYEQDKIIYIGGGNDRVPGNASMDEARPPTNRAEIIDLGTESRPSGPTPAAMHFPRRQHNAVLLPDGTVLVIGGTRGGGGASGGTAWSDSMT